MMKPNIYKYHNYRSYIKDLIAYVQRSQPELSLRKLSQKCGFAVGYLPMVLSEKRNLTIASLDAMKKPLLLKNDEVAYLKYIMELNDSNSRETKLKTLKKMQKFQKYNDENAKELEAYKYLTKWHYVALREMIQLKEFNSDPAWIQERMNFPVSPKEIMEGLEFLINYNFIEKTTQGKYQVKEKILDCFDGVYRLSLGEFYKQIFNLAIESIDSVPRHERLLLGHTFAVSHEAFDKVSAVLNEALEKIRDIEKKDNHREQIYQVSLAAFPLTKKG